jgi:hypothetical protein
VAAFSRWLQGSARACCDVRAATLESGCKADSFEKEDLFKVAHGFVTRSCATIPMNKDWSQTSALTCAQCGAEYRSVQAPHKPEGVSMQLLCDCTPIVISEGGVTVTLLLPPEGILNYRKKEAAIKKMKLAIGYMRHAVKVAAESGDVEIGILSVKPDGTGKIVAMFEAPEFFDDLALLIGAPEQTKEDDMKAEAAAILDGVGPFVNRVRIL